MALREVRNKAGDLAMFDDETGNIMPTQPKTASEAPVVSQTTLKQIRNKKTGGTALYDPDTGAIFPQQAVNADIQRTADHLDATHPQRGTDLNLEPIEPHPAPRPMGGTYDFDIKTGKMVEPSKGGSYGPAAAILSPASRIPAAVTGAVSSVAEDIGKGETPSVKGAVLGGLGGFVSPEVAKVVKAGYRGAASMFGRGPLKEAGNAIYSETKALTKPVATTNTENEIMNQVATFGRTAPQQSQKTVVDVFDKIAGAKAAGKPLSYGEVFNNATQLNQEIHNLYGGKFKEAAGQLEKIHGKMMEDLAAAGPEAQAAVDSYKRAVGAFGGYGGVVQAVKKLTGVGTGGAALVAAALKPSTAWVSAPAALLGGIANLSTRLPGGVGEGIAKALIKDPGNISLGAARALAESINSQTKEY